MQRLIYCSQAVKEFTSDELIALLERARRNNERLGLTGMLLYSNQSFMQVLEGDAKHVDRVYTSIVQDPRHTNLRLLMDDEISVRMFPDWTMGFEHVEDEDLAEVLEGFTPDLEYPLVDPKLISNASIAQTLLELYAKNRGL